MRQPKRIHQKLVVAVVVVVVGDGMTSVAVADGAEQVTIREATAHDFDSILSVINEAAMAYKGVIPADAWVAPAP